MVLGGVLPDSPVVHVGVIVAASVAIWFGSGWLETSAEDLSAHYGLPPVVQGSIVVAVGSSFPEFTSVVVAAATGVFDIGVGAIVGSAIFNVLVIPALSGVATDGELDANRTIVYKEAQFYMLAVSTLVITFALAVIYAPVPDGTELTGRVTRPLAAIPLLLYGLYLFIQCQDVGDYEAPGDAGDDVDVPRVWGTLALGLLVILLAVHQLVGSVESLSHTVGMAQFLAGVTIVAAATSLPDTLVSVRTAQADQGTTSLGNVLGSNTFDLLVAIPVGVLLVGSVPIDFAVALPLLGVLTLATVLLFTALRTDLHLTTGESLVLLGTYVVFVAWMVTETVGATNLIRVG